MIYSVLELPELDDDESLSSIEDDVEKVARFTTTTSEERTKTPCLGILHEQSASLLPVTDEQTELALKIGFHAGRNSHDATPLWNREAKAVSPLRSATAPQKPGTKL